VGVEVSPKLLFPPWQKVEGGLVVMAEYLVDLAQILVENEVLGQIPEVLVQIPAENGVLQIAVAQMEARHFHPQISGSRISFDSCLASHMDLVLYYHQIEEDQNLDFHDFEICYQAT